MKKSGKRKESLIIQENLSDRIKKLKIPVQQILVSVLAFVLCAIAFLRSSIHEPAEFAGRLIIYIIMYCITIFLCSRQVTKRKLSTIEVYVLSVITLVYLLIDFFISHLSLLDGFLPNSLLLPSALVVMLVSILIDTRLSITLSLSLPMCVFIARGLDLHAYIVAVSSAVTGALVIKGARRRMDMVIAGFVVAAVNILATSATLLIKHAPPSIWPPVLFWALFNGAVSGALVLSTLPIFENALHIATTFKLIELLDTDAPLLRRLENTAPGTYSHSMEVAKLAEAACREIGANALLARVGAYYHDIGKIDKPDYFVENQGIYNKHNELNPRLSATVIRSHVKLGIEKARAIGLPNELVEIIGCHHGDSLIAWFYNEAVKREGEGNVNKEDFCYPGNPPKTKEAAVMMLADVTEAACRTLEKPTSSRLEKFINDLIDKKVEARQLVESELTFHDIELVKKTFVRALVAHYHARIEYPNQQQPA
ncbi:MAG: HDIG domain-containing protein [Spirochaetaceae bacterium]|jgi:putative nucleotidyltransferase with HDIG domain|nr:HDIG domain-containing protein [Spirochaetaceae bacterium]